MRCWPRVACLNLGCNIHQTPWRTLLAVWSGEGVHSRYPASTRFSLVWSKPRSEEISPKWTACISVWRGKCALSAQLLPPERPPQAGRVWRQVSLAPPRTTTAHICRSSADDPQSDAFHTPMSPCLLQVAPPRCRSSASVPWAKFYAISP